MRDDSADLMEVYRRLAEKWTCRLYQKRIATELEQHLEWLEPRMAFLGNQWPSLGV